VTQLHERTQTPPLDDPEASAYRALARALAELPEGHRPEDALQVVVNLARELTAARYSALAVTDEHDRTQGFVVSGLTKEQERALPTPPQGHGPLGSLRADGRAVRYADLEHAPRLFGFPPSHPKMKSLLGVPVWVRTDVRGSLYVADREDDRPFTDDDERALVALAHHATHIVEQEWY